MENLLWDLRFAARTLRRQPAFAFSTVITLGMAIALAATAYGILYAYLVRSIPYPAAERLVHLRPTPRGGAYVNAPSLAAVDWRATDSIFEKSVSWNPDRFILRHADRAHVMEGAWASPDFFAALGIQPVLGRGFASREYHGYAPVMMISDALWSRLFARDSAVVGRAMRVQSLESTTDAELLTVVGIMPPPTWHVGRDVDVLRPLQSDPHLMPLMARLKPGMSGAEAERRLNAVVLPQLGAIDPAYGLSLVELRTQYTSRVRPTLILLTAGAGFLLLVAGASVSGAQTARMTARRPEIVLRSTLGASRARIAAQLVVENLLIAVLASIVGAAVAQAVLATFGGAIGQRLGLAVPGGDEQLALGLGMLAAIVTAALLLGAMFGLLPAMITLRGSAGSAGTGASLAGGKGIARTAASSVLRRGLIVAQVAITMMLLVGAGLMTRTIMAIAATPLGFDEEGIVKTDLVMPLARYRNEAAWSHSVERILARVAEETRIQTAAALPDPLRTSFGLSPVEVLTDGSLATGAARPRAVVSRVTPGYFQLLNIPIRAGRAFESRDDGRAVPVAIVSQDLARHLWPRESAIGQRIRATDDSLWRTVVGIAGDTRRPADADPLAELYVPYAQRPFPIVSIMARVANPGDLETALQHAEDGVGFGAVRPLSDVAAGLTRRHRTLATVLSIFAALGLVLAALGVYASLAYVVAQRRREIAIRVAVGANGWAVRRLVVGEAVAVVAGGLILGLGLSFWISRLLASQLYGVSPTDPATLAVIAALLGASALAAAVAPLRKAVRVSPAEIMRNELP